jgi:hypothetical protein
MSTRLLPPLRLTGKQQGDGQHRVNENAEFDDRALVQRERDRVALVGSNYGLALSGLLSGTSAAGNTRRYFQASRSISRAWNSVSRASPWPTTRDAKNADHALVARRR